jgi:hypothetical protein
MSAKTTCACGAHSRPRQRNCLACHREAQRKYRATHPLIGDARLKSRVRALSRHYQVHGKLVAQPCSCGSTKVERHHPDYGDPLQVVWMCRPCHLALHAAERDSRGTRDTTSTAS